MGAEGAFPRQVLPSSRVQEIWGAPQGLCRASQSLEKCNCAPVLMGCNCIFYFFQPALSPTEPLELWLEVSLVKEKLICRHSDTGLGIALLPSPAHTP